jgi:hypothetical protein
METIIIGCKIENQIELNKEKIILKKIKTENSDLKFYQNEERIIRFKNKFEFIEKLKLNIYKEETDEKEIIHLNKIIIIKEIKNKKIIITNENELIILKDFEIEKYLKIPNNENIKIKKMYLLILN